MKKIAKNARPAAKTGKKTHAPSKARVKAAVRKDDVCTMPEELMNENSCCCEEIICS